MKQTLEILLAYLTCDDPIIANKWLNILHSFWHKDTGLLVKSIEADDTNYKINLVDSDGATHEHLIPKLPNSMPISFIQDLDSKLEDKVDKIAGKGLSTHDFSTSLKSKLENLTQYVHPALHQIVEIENLQQVLDQKVDKVAGKGLSPEEFTASHKQQVADNSTNKQSEITDATGDFTLTDAHFRTTFFINTTGICNVTIPTGILRANFVCYFIVIGTAQLNVMVDGGGATLIAPDGTLISSGGKGVIEKKLALDTFYASGSFEV